MPAMKTPAKKIVLPTELHVPDSGWPKQATWLVIGAPKTGKTKFAASWPRTFILNFELRGTRYIEDAFCEDVDSLAELRGWFGTLKAAYDAGERPYDTIAIDTIDVVKDLVYAGVLDDMGISEMGEAKKRGDDWLRGREGVLNILRQFSQLPVNLLIIAHSKPVVIGDRTVGTTVDLPGSLARYVMGSVENILNCTVTVGRYQVCPQRHSAAIDAGSRLPALNLIQACPTSYNDLRAAFDREVAKEATNADGK